MQDLVVVERDQLPSPYGERGYVSTLRQPWQGVPGLALAARLCVHVQDDGPVLGLAQLMKRVPEEYLRPVSRLSDRRQAYVVLCPCGTAQETIVGVTECAGDCGRWYAADDSTVWAIKLPEQEA